MRISIFFILLIAIFSGCKDVEISPEFPVVFTEQVENINAGGAEFVGKIKSHATNHNIIEYGFVWDEAIMPTLQSSHVLLSGGASEGKFSKIVTYGLAADTIYYVRAFVRTEKLLVYGNQVEFKSMGSLPPEIIDFDPKQGHDGSIISIYGYNFSSGITGNNVKLGELECEVISASDTLLTIKTPVTKLVGDFVFSISVAGKTALAQTEYSILGPRIRSVSALNSRVGDLIVIEGDFFDLDYPQVVFEFPGLSPEYTWVHSQTSDRITLYVPDKAGKTGKIKIKNYKKEFTYPENFTIKDSWKFISNFGNLSQYSATTIGNFIFIAGEEVVYKFDMITKNTVALIKPPGGYRLQGASFTHNGKLYYGLGRGYSDDALLVSKFFNDLWCYDPVAGSWEQIADIPISARYNPVSFVIGDKAYIGLGQTSSYHDQTMDFWEFDLQSKTWKEISHPFTYYMSNASFTISNKAYLVGVTLQGGPFGWYSNVWEFDPSNYTWKEKSGFPEPIRDLKATIRDNTGLVITSGSMYNLNNSLFEYDPETDTWIRRQSIRYSSSNGFLGFYNGKLYYSSDRLMELSFD